MASGELVLIADGVMTTLFVMDTDICKDALVVLVNGKLNSREEKYCKYLHTFLHLI